MLCFPGGQLELQAHLATSEFGLGDASPAHPEWTGGFRRFHLYGYAEPADRRALLRLAMLTPEEREHLWRQRAVIHAVIRRWDEHLRWSRREEWRRINGWVNLSDSLFAVKEKALNVYAGAYSRDRGTKSSALDLATFAEEALVPAEDFHPGAVTVDDQLACQEFTKMRYVQERLDGVAGLHVAWTRPLCPAFETWANFATLDHFEVIFSAPSGAHAESIFGHVLLRPARKAAAYGFGSGSDTVVEIAAVTDLSIDALRFLWKGLTGKYQTIFGITTLGAALKQNTAKDQRNLRRYWLHLTPGEQQRLMERIWEVERRGYLSYYFFNENCAAQLIWLLNGVLDPARKIERPGSFWVMPTATLDAMARVEALTVDSGGHPEPLLTYLPGDYLSHQQDALDADDERGKVLADIEARSAPELALQWQAEDLALHSPQSGTRRAAYDAMPALVDATVGGRGALDTISQDVYRLMSLSQRVERFSADEADRAEDSLRKRTVLMPQGTRFPSADDLVAERQKQYEHENPNVRAISDRDRLMRLTALVDNLPRRPFTAVETAALERELANKQPFLRLNEVVGDLNDRYFGELQDEAPPPELMESTVGPPPKDTLPGSGYGRFSAGAGVYNTSDHGTFAAINLRSAIVAEQLGDPRQRGFGPENELHLLDVETDLRFNPKDLSTQVLRIDSQVIRARFMGRPPVAGRSSWRDWFGFGAGADFSYTRIPHTHSRTTVDADLYAILDASAHYARYTILGIGPSGSVGFNGYVIPTGGSLGAQVRLAQRIPLPGHQANALRVEASATPQWVMVGPERFGTLNPILKVSVELETVLAQDAARAWLFRPRFTLSRQTIGREVVQEMQFTLSGELL